jgi:hypothetical protein
MNENKPIAIVAVVLAAIVGGAIWYFARLQTPASNATPPAVTATEAPLDAKGQDKPVDLPPLEQMDAFLKPLLQALSTRPELANWLATDDLVRQLAMALDQAEAGRSPARDFKVVAPSGRFAAVRRSGKQWIDPAGYKRYDGLVETVTSIDASRVAAIYRTIRPRLNEAYQAAGNAGSNVDAAVVKTLDILIETPTVKDPVEVIGSDGLYAYVDEDLESLLPTQKQLLRMGPANVERLRAWLRALRDAVGN